ncbi:hypothetical protein TMatcc_010139 [Talaromyces marneffei ATCC 18224]
MVRLNEMIESLKALETDRRLSYLAPQEGHDEEEGVTAEEGTYTEEDFLKEARLNPKQLFDFMHIMKQYRILYQEHEEDLAEKDDLKEEFDALKAEHKKVRKNMEQLQSQHQELEADRDMFRDAFARVQLRVSSEPGTAGATANHATDRTPKSTKLPKGSKLSDGAEPTFESWLIDMRASLDNNRDHYETPGKRMAFVKRMCEGRASKHLLPRMRDDSPNPFTDAEDMFEHLKTIFLDVNRVNKAKDKLYILQMKKDTRFQDFLADFTQLAQDSELEISSWKNELYRKLNFEMQHAVMKEADEEGMRWAAFVNACYKTANRLEQINLAKDRIQRRGGAARSNIANNNSNPASRASTPGTGQAKGGNNNDANKNRSGWIDNAARAALMKEGKCFKCFQPGHIGRDCSNTPASKPYQAPNKAADLKELEKEGSDDSDGSDSENGTA